MFNKQAKAEPPPAPPKPKKVFKWKTSDETAAAAAGAEGLNAQAAVPPPAPSPTPGAPTDADAAAGPALTTEPPASSAEPAGTETSAKLEPVSSRVSAKSAASSESQGQAGKPGFSAEDARATSGSLKDRIALLSGLKVDQPAAPGRAPKPWRKKTIDPADEPASSDAPSVISATAESSSAQGSARPDIKVATEVAQELAPGTDTPGEPIAEKAPALPRPTSPTDNLANVVDTEVKSPVEQVQSPVSARDTPSGSIGGVALPSMPTRARGPARKGRGGAASGGTGTIASPVADKAPDLFSIAQKTGGSAKDEPTAPGIAEIGSPAEGPKQFLDNEIFEGNVSQEADGADRAEAAAPPTVPPPPPPISSSRLQADSDEEPEAPHFDDDDGTTGVIRTLATQTLESEPSETADSVPEVPKSPSLVPSASRSVPPMPARIDTNMTSPVTEDEQPLSPVNRRSMNRPPVPGAFQQEVPAALPDKKSFEGIEARRQSSMAGIDSSQDVAEEVAEDGGFANPAIDSKNVPEPPPVSAPIDAEGTASPAAERPSMSPAHSRQSSLKSPVAAAPPPLPAGRPTPAPAQASEPGQSETNIGASSTYWAESAEPPEAGEGDNEEYEDPEAARRQALAKRMAAMGGMKIGMLPPMFGGGGSKRKPTLPKDADVEQPKSPISPSAEVPIDPAPTPALASSGAEAPAAPSRPVPAPSGLSYRPPAGAFVLPGIGKPPSAPPAPPPEAIDQELEEEIAAGRASPDEADGADEADVEKGDETVTQEDANNEEGVVEEDDEQDEAPSAPPPLPSGRPTRMPPPPTGQSFIDVDTDTDVASKRTSMTSSMSTGVGDTSAFPQPPGAPHTRTISTASRISGPVGEQILEEGQEADDEEAYHEAPQPPTPSRPARAPPAIDTDAQTLASDTDTHIVQSPRRSASMHSNASLPQTPMSPIGRQASFSQMSPTASPSSGSRRSSTMVASSAGAAPPVGISHAYLAHLGASAARTKSKEIDGALAKALNEIAFSRRTDPGNFGHPVWRTYVSGEKGQAPDLQINGRIEAGCIFSAWDAKFDKGLGRSSLKVGSLEVPHVGVVCEDVKDIKKVREHGLTSRSVADHCGRRPR